MIQAPTTKDIVLPKIGPNAGVRARYQRQVDALVDDMQASLDYWLLSAYKNNTPEMAQDASPAATMAAAMRKMARRWLTKFDDAAKKIATGFADGTLRASDSAFQKNLRDAGFTVKFKQTAEMNDAYRAIVAENVGLIKSIAQQHLTQVQTIVMQSVQNGRDLKFVRDQLTNRYDITSRRAALIARDQNNKATSVMVRARQQALGITQAIWVHSGAGKEPRPSHVKANGQKYDISKGMFLDGVWTWPGVEINCRCTQRPVIPGFE